MCRGPAPRSLPPPAICSVTPASLPSRCGRETRADLTFLKVTARSECRGPSAASSSAMRGWMGGRSGSLLLRMLTGVRKTGCEQRGEESADQEQSAGIQLERPAGDESTSACVSRDSRPQSGRTGNALFFCAGEEDDASSQLLLALVLFSSVSRSAGSRRKAGR